MKKTLLSLALMIATTVGVNAQVTNYSVGQTVNDFTVTDVHGNTHNLSAIAASGKWILIDFFFTTCPPCQSTVPFFSELHEKYGCNQSDLYCISIDTGDSDAEVLGFESTYSTSTGFSPAPAVSGTEGGGNAVISDFGPSAYPTYCLVGSDMKMKNTDIWPISSMADFEAAVTAAGHNPTPMACAAGIEEVAVNDFNVYPNPAANNATISVNLDATADVVAKVYNMIGAEVATQAFNGNSGQNLFSLNTSDLENGQYILKVSFDDKVKLNLA